MAEDKKEGRFIKTGKTEYHSVRAEKAAEENVTEVSTFADRFTTRATEAKVHTGYTGKLNTYDAAHSAGAAGGRRMIDPKGLREVPDDVGAAAAPEVPAPAAAPEPAPEPESEMFRFDETQAVIASEAPDDVRVFIPEREKAALNAASAAAEKAQGPAPVSPDGPTRPVAQGEGFTRPMPSAKGERMRQIAGTADADVRQNPYHQMIMQGFNDAQTDGEAEPPKEDGVLTEKLEESRKRLIERFKAHKKTEPKNEDRKFTPENGVAPPALPGPLQRFADRFSKYPDRFTPVNTEEYTDYNERKPVFAALLDARRLTMARTVFVGVLGFVLLLIDLITRGSAAKDPNGLFSVFGSSKTVYLTVNLVFLLISAVCMLPELKSGVLSALKLRPKTDTLLPVTLFGAAVQVAAGYLSALNAESDYRLLTPAAILLCVPYLVSKLFYYESARHCFKAVANRSDKSYLRSVSDPEMAERFLCGKTDKKGNVVYQGRTRFVSGLIARSARGAFDVMPSSRTVFLCFTLSLVAAVVGWVVKGSFLFAAAAFTFCCAVSFPVCGLVLCGWMLANENGALSKKSSFILHYTDAHDFTAVDNIALDSDDLFTGSLTGCLTADGVREKQARFVAAAVAAQAGSLMNGIFSADIAEFGEKLPTPENMVYEEKLGLSAWVNNCKVLLGTRALLDHHSAQVPPEDQIRKILSKGNRPLYLAMEGHFAAVFAVRYETRKKVKEGVSALVERGTNLLITTSDANITETFVEETLDLSASCVRMVSAAAAEQLRAARAVRSDAEAAGIVFEDSFLGLCRCATAAIRLRRTQKLAQTFSNFGAYAMLAVGLILTVSGVFARVSSIAPVLLQCAWIGLGVGVLIMTNRMSAGAESEKKKPDVGGIRLPEFSKKTKKEADAPQEEIAPQTEDASSPSAGSPDPEAPLPEDAPAQAEEEAAGETAAPAEAPEKPRRPVPKDTVFEIEVPVKEDAPSEAPQPPVQKKQDGRAKQDGLKKVGEEAKQAGKQAASALSKKVRGLFAGLTAAPEDENEGFEELQTNTPEPKKKRASAPDEASAVPHAPAESAAPAESNKPFSLYAEGSVRERASTTAEDVEKEYAFRRVLEKEVGATFTPPEQTAPPYFDLSGEEEPFSFGEFTPPSTGGVDFDEALFKRFEDERMIAEMYENSKKKGKRDDNE